MHGIFSNLRYMCRTYRREESKYLPLLATQVLASTAGVFFALLLPRYVLDGGGIPGIALMALGLTLVKAVSVRLQTLLDEHAWHFFYFFGYAEINRRRMRLDYERYVSPEGSDRAHKALRAVSGYTFSSIAAFFIYLKDMIVALMGFGTFSAILMTLEPWLIPGLVATYALNMLAAWLVEKWNYVQHDDEARLWRKKQYFAKELSLTRYAKDIRLYSMAGLIRTLRRTLLDEELRLNASRQRRALMQLVVQALIVFIRDGLAYAYLIYAMLNDPAITLGMFTMYFAAIAGFGDQLGELAEAGQGFMEANGYVSDLRDFMDMELPEPAARSQPDSPCGIRLEHVSYKYPGSEAPVLEDISLDIAPGERLALVGMNGAGKSTLVKLICGLLRPTSGKIYVNGIDIAEISAEDIFAAVFQHSELMPATIARNITFRHTLTPAENARMWHALEEAELADKVRALPQGEHTLLMRQFHPEAVELSGGEVQKLMLARALYRAAPVLLLDEPTAAMDPIAENALYQRYARLMQGKTSVFISHRLSSTAFCDRVALLDRGKLAELGPHAQLMAQNGLYARMFRASAKYYREGSVHENA